MKRNGSTSSFVGVCYIQRTTGTKGKIESTSKTPWLAFAAYSRGKKLTKGFETEREAAIQADKWTIQYRLDRPLNILKRT